MSAPATPTQPKQAFAGPLLETGGLWLVIVLAGVVLIAGLLNHLQQQELKSIERAQIELTLLEIEAGLELDLSRGLDLDDNRHIQPLLESSLEKDPQLYSLDVLDANGRTIFSTDRGTVGELLPPTVLAAAQNASTQPVAAQQPTWNGLIGGTPVMGIVLHGPFNQAIGHISATYSSRMTDNFADRAMLIRVALVLLATMLAGSIIIWLATHPQRQLLRQQLTGRLPQIHGKIHCARQRLDDGSTRLDEVERIE